MNSRPKRASQGFYGATGGSGGTVSHGPGNTFTALGGATRPAASHQGIFQEVVRNGDACGLQRLLEELQNKVDVNSYNNDGQTALHQSCQDGNLELVKLLVQFGADVRLANRDGWSALHIAAWSGHREIAMYLINAYKR